MFRCYRNFKAEFSSVIHAVIVGINTLELSRPKDNFYIHTHVRHGFMYQ